jgi:hypothetical protein
MDKHEEKLCASCGANFECKVGSILLCQCMNVPLNENERDYINKKYDDCLCAKCMLALKKEYHHQLFKEKLKKISGLFNK